MKMRCVCGKVALSKAEAKRRLDRVAREVKSENGRRAAIYKCRKSGVWHITTHAFREVRPSKPEPLSFSVPLRAKPQPRQPWEPRPARSRVA